MVLALQSSVSSKLDVLKWESAINSLAPQFLYTEVVGIILHLVICCTQIFLQGEGNASTTRFLPIIANPDDEQSGGGMGSLAVMKEYISSTAEDSLICFFRDRFLFYTF